MKNKLKTLKFYLKHHAQIKAASAETGRGAREIMRDARRFIMKNTKQMISANLYFNQKLYMMSPEEQSEWLRNRRLRRRKRSNLVKAVAGITGWTEKHAKEEMDAARDKYGVSYWVYYRHECWNKTPEEMKAAQKKYLNNRRAKADKEAAEKETAVRNVMDYLGVSEEEAESVIAESVAETDCLYAEFNEFEMYKYPMEVQKQMFLKNFSNKISLKYETDFEVAALLRDKKKSNEAFKEYVRRPWCMNRDVSFEEFCETFKGVSKIFYKPNNLQGGKGAVPFELNESNMREVYDEVMSYRTGVIEKFIVQHPEMSRLSPTAVNTIRFATIYSDKAPVNSKGDHMVIAYAVQKMGGENSVVDNLHQGGIAAIVDTETGIICTDGIDMHSNIIRQHPVSGTTIKGFRIPYFEEAKEMIFKMLEEFHMVGYLGWDVCIEEDGPTVVEVNGRPGVNLTTHTLAVTEQRGIRQEMEQYL